MALASNEFARRVGGAVEIVPAAVRVSWPLNGMTTSDAHTMSGRFTASVQLADNPTDRKMFAEVLLGSKPVLTISDLSEHFGEAIRNAADLLTARPQLGRDVFGRGAPEPIADIKRPEWTATLYDLLSAYAQQRQKHALAHVRFAPRTVWSLAEAREALERMVGLSHDWGRLDEYLMSYLVDPSMRATVMASSFASVLEMVREGALEVHQHQAFAPIFLRKRADAAGAQTPGRA